MANMISEDFYRCECGCGTFNLTVEYVLKKDSDTMTNDECAGVEAAYKRRKYIYKCTGCGKTLPRGGRK